MKKLIVGLVILGLLLALGLWNAFAFRGRMLELENHVRAASILVGDGDIGQGIKLLENAIDTWEEYEKYTHIFLHHDGIDGISDAFYEYLSTLHSRRADDAATRNRLIYRIQSIYKLEIPTIGALF